MLEAMSKNLNVFAWLSSEVIARMKRKSEKKRCFLKSAGVSKMCVWSASEIAAASGPVATQRQILFPRHVAGGLFFK